MAEISNRSEDVNYFLNKDTTDNESTLTKQFLLGLVFDTKNKWIEAVRNTFVRDKTCDSEVRDVIQQHLKTLCDDLRAEVRYMYQ